MKLGFESLGCAISAAVAATAMTGLVFTSAAAQEDFPSKPITLIVPWSAGGGSDTSMRLVAEAAEKTLGQPVVVENRPGAGGAEGTRAIERAEPDGYTIGMVGSGVIARHYGNPNATDFNDLEPIAFFGADPGALTANPSTGFESVEDFVNAAKAEPGSVVNGNDQPGGSSYITAAVIENELGIELTKVPYEGFAPTVAALLAGEIQTATVPVPDVIEHHKAGDLVILGVTDTERHFLAEDVPTFEEQGFDVTMGSWRMIVGPEGIPEDRLATLEEGLVEAMSDSGFVDKANTAGFGVSPMGSKETAEFLESYDETLYPVLEASDLVETRAKD